GTEVLVSDVDTSWVRDPRPFLTDPSQAPAQADFSVSTDCLSNKEYETGDGCINRDLNTGVLHLRSTNQTISFLESWRDGLLQPRDKFENDQGVFNRVLRARLRPRHGVQARNGSLVSISSKFSISLLPVTTFAGGHVFFAQQLPQRLGQTPFVVHTTYQFSHVNGKRQRLREHGLWYRDPPEYYNPAGSMFITFDPSLPPQLQRAMAQLSLIEKHMRAAAFYRLSVRNALAVAQALGRILIVPAFQCFCDRWWGNALPECIIPGSDQVLPYQCPMDHLFYLPHWADLPFREHSFLDNPGVPPHVRDSIAQVHVRSAPRRTSAAPPSSPSAAVVHEGLTDAQLQAALSPLNGTHVLNFTSTAMLFCRFEKHEENIAFDQRMEIVLKAEVWFCANQPRGRSCTIGYDRPPPLSGVDCASRGPQKWSDLFTVEQLEGKKVCQGC
ncbi:hypothetical protein CYMTET_17531, partial [Cymbomonas tetramitiformis]